MTPQNEALRGLVERGVISADQASAVGLSLWRTRAKTSAP
jgi:hypothetical protein